MLGEIISVALGGGGKPQGPPAVVIGIAVVAIVLAAVAIFRSWRRH